MKRIKDLKTRGVGTYGIARSATLAEAARELVAKSVSALVVYEGEAMVGILTKNDMVRACAHGAGDPGALTVGEHMKTDLYTTTIDANLDDVVRVMIERGFRHVPVLEDGKVVGMVTPIDILLYERDLLTRENVDLLHYIQGIY